MREFDPECDWPWHTQTMGGFSAPQPQTPPMWPPRTPPGCCEPSPVAPLTAIPSRMRRNMDPELAMSAGRRLRTPSRGCTLTPRTLQTPKYYIKRGSEAVEWDKCPSGAPSPVAAAIAAQDPLEYFKSLGYPIADEEPEYTEEEQREMDCLYPPLAPPPPYHLGEAPEEGFHSRMYRQFVGGIMTPSSYQRASINPRPMDDCDRPSPMSRRKLF